MKKDELIFLNVLSEKGRVQRDELIMAFGKCGLCSDGKILYDYDPQHVSWLALENEKNRKLREMLPSYLQAKISSTLLSGVADDLIENPELYVNFRKKLQPYKLNLKNMALDLRTGQKIERFKEDFFDYYVDCNCLDLQKVTINSAPHFRSFMRTSLGTDVVPERAKLLLQILAIAICSVPGIKKMVFVVGPSGGGKSIFLRFIENVVGIKHRSAIAFQDMNQRFRLLEMAHSRVNLCHEVQNGKVKSLDIIKKLVSGEPVTVERKGVDAFTISPIAKLITAANCLPPLGEADNGAVIARILLILFPNSVSMQVKDPDLLQKLLTEKDVIVTLAIQELCLLIKNNFMFVVPAQEKSYLETYAQSENSVKSFAEEECVTGAQARVHYKDLLQAYKKFCDNNNFRSLSDMDVKQFFLGQPGIRPKKIRFNGHNWWGVEGIGLISNTFTQDTEKHFLGGVCRE